MTDFILAIAAYVCLGLGVALLVVRLGGERLQRGWEVVRFRRKLRKLDKVAADWSTAIGSGDSTPPTPPAPPAPPAPESRPSNRKRSRRRTPEEG